MNNQDIITLYRAMSVITGAMLVAARAEDWELLTILESRSSAHLQTLKDNEPQQALSSVEREQKISIIEKILADDSEIRKLSESWMAQLSTLINSASTERKLSQAYGAE